MNHVIPIHPPRTRVSRNLLNALPDEIQLIIYSLLVTFDRTISPRLHRDKFIHADNVDYYCWEHGWAWQRPGDVQRLEIIQDRMRMVQEIAKTASILSATCHSISRLVQDEALFYRLNTFRFRRSDYMGLFLFRMGRHSRQSIKSINFRMFNTAEQRLALMLLATCSGLNHLVIDVSYMASQLLTLNAIPGLEHVLSMRGLRSFTLTYCKNTIVQAALKFRFGEKTKSMSKKEIFKHEVDIMFEIAEFEERMCRAVTSQCKEDSIRPSGEAIEQEFSRYYQRPPASPCVISC